MWDVIVAGGGTAGVIAAIASARCGASTLMVERYGFPGGAAAYGIPFLAFIAGDGTRVVNGIPQELVDRMTALGGCAGHKGGGQWRTGDGYAFAVTPYDCEVYKYAVFELLKSSGAGTLMHTGICGVRADGSAIGAVEVANKDGKQWLEARVFVDATGDADCLAGAGFACTKGDGRGRMQNVSLIFHLGGVDMERMARALAEGDGILGWQHWHTRIIRGGKLGSDEPGIIHMAGHMQPWRDDRLLTFTAVSLREGVVSFNITRTVGVDGTNAGELSESEWSERRNMMSLLEALRRNVPGFEKAYIAWGAPQVGVRETRNIVGEYVLTGDDVTRCREFDDNVARGCYPIDIHDPAGGKTRFHFLKNGGSYGIPYRALVPKGSVNALAAGRCVSATHEAHGSVRIMATAMAVGQAAGTAAALLAQGNAGSCMGLDTGRLRAMLRENGAVIDRGDVLPASP